MILNANKYRINIPKIQSLIDNKPEEKYVIYIGAIALATNVPIIVVACYVGELYGFTEELRNYISRLMQFYCVEEVINVNNFENNVIRYIPNIELRTN